jgi:hypothetical protein
MAHDPQKIQELAIQIEALDPADRMELLRLVSSPEEEFFRLVKRLHRKNRSFSPRTIARDVNLAVREVRAKRTSSRSSSKPPSPEDLGG